MAGLAQVVDQRLFEFEAGMIGAYGYFHLCRPSKGLGIPICSFRALKGPLFHQNHLAET
jgi:hypothetical protein